jgi:plastocyanin
MRTIRILAVLVGAVGSAGGLACGSNSTAPTNNGSGTPGGGHALVINANPDIKFKPTPDTVSAGDTVQFAWSSVGHNVQWDNTPAAIASIGNGSVGFTSGDSTRVMSARGTYTYHCGIHGSAMSGVIVVR